MSDDFWLEMQDLATELLSEFQTGTTRLVRIARTPVSVDRPYDKDNGAPAYTNLHSVVKPVDKKMVDNSLVFDRNSMVVCSHPGFDILGTDMVEVDGRQRKILKIRRMPDAGIAVVWFLAIED